MGEVSLSHVIVAAISSLLGGGVAYLAIWALFKDRIIEDVLLGDEGYTRHREKLIQDLLRIFAKKSALEATNKALDTECEHRKRADAHRDQEQHRVSELVQQFIGRGEILERRQEEADRAREREVAALREEVRTGFARIEAAIERRNGQQPQ